MNAKDHESWIIHSLRISDYIQAASKAVSSDSDSEFWNAFILKRPRQHCVSRWYFNSADEINSTKVPLNGAIANKKQWRRCILNIFSKR